MNEQEHPHPVYVRVREPIPYAVTDWPGRVGFTFEPCTGCWVRDAWKLVREDAKHWRLSHPDVAARRIVTNCHHPESIALDLAWQVREAVEAS